MAVRDTPRGREPNCGHGVPPPVRSHADPPGTTPAGNQHSCMPQRWHHQISKPNGVIHKCQSSGAARDCSLLYTSCTEKRLLLGAGQGVRAVSVRGHATHEVPAGQQPVTAPVVQHVVPSCKQHPDTDVRGRVSSSSDRLTHGYTPTRAIDYIMIRKLRRTDGTRLAVLIIRMQLLLIITKRNLQSS